MLVQLALIALLAVLIGSLLVSAISYARAWRMRKSRRPEKKKSSLIKFSTVSKPRDGSRLKKVGRFGGYFSELNRCQFLAVAVFSSVFAVFSIQWQSIRISLPNYVSENIPVPVSSAPSPDIAYQCMKFLTEAGNRSTRTQPKSIEEVGDFLYYSNSQNSALGLAAAQISDDGLPSKAEFLCGNHLGWIYKNFVGRSLSQRYTSSQISYNEAGIEIYITSAEERERLVIYKSPDGEVSASLNFVSFSYHKVKLGDFLQLSCQVRYHFLPWSYYEEFSSRTRGITIEARRIFDVPLFLVGEGNGLEVFWGSFQEYVWRSILTGLEAKHLKFTKRSWGNEIRVIDSYWNEWEQTFNTQKIMKALGAYDAASAAFIGGMPTQNRRVNRSGSAIVNSEQCQEALREARNSILKDG